MSENELFTQHLTSEQAAIPNPKALTVEAAKKAKQVRIAKEKAELEARLAQGNLEDTRTRVAYLLNQYPNCRNSDIELSIRYWKTFDRDHLDGDGISFEAFRKVTRMNSLIRARATIQNTFKLFGPEDKIAGFRDENQQKVRRRQRAASLSSVPFVQVYSDESGKTDASYIVGSVWVNDVDGQALELMERLNKWRASVNWTSEIHFKKITPQSKNDYVEFFRQALLSSHYVGFKATILLRSDVKNRPTEDAIFSLYYRLAVEGIQHEIDSRRFQLPRNFVLWKDEDEGSDKLHLLNLRDKMRAECPKHFDNQIDVMGVNSINSSKNVLMMLADVFTGSVNRIVNRSPANPRNQKDDVVEAIMSMLGVNLSEPLNNVRGDFVRLITL